MLRVMIILIKIKIKIKRISRLKRVIIQVLEPAPTFQTPG